MKRILVLCFAAMLATQAWAAATTFEVDNLKYTVIEGTTNVSVEKGSTAPTNELSIPSSVEYNGTPYTVTSIGNSAFFGCSGLTSITIPQSVISIGDYAFLFCDKLTNISVENGNTKYTSEDGVLFNYNKTTLICFPTGKNGTYTIPESVNSIDIYAFENCKGLTSINIPNSVTSIGRGAFQNCSSLTSITIPESVTSIGDKTFENCSGLTSIVIPESVTNIAHSAFFSCNNLLSSYDNAVYLTNNDNPYYALMYASSYQITSCIINSKCKIVANNAFEQCGKLTSVTIGNSVTSIGDWAFQRCYVLTSVTIPNSVASIGNNAFQNCSKLTFVTIPNSVTSIGDYAFERCGLTSVTIGNSVTNIGDYAFSGCSKLTSVTIGNSVTNIGDYAFSECLELASATISNTVMSIGINAFDRCNKLTKADFASIESLCRISFGSNFANPLYFAENLFINGEKVTNLIIPETVTGIGKYAFSYGNLAYIIIPNTVTSIGEKAFYGCKNTTYLYCQAASKPTGWDTRWDYGSNVSVRWGCKVIKLNINNTEHGIAKATGYSVKATDGSIWYLNNAQITLTATPNEGYHVKWEDNSTNNVRTFSAIEDKTYTATFEAHAEEINAAYVAATCTETGLTEGKRCSECGAILVAQEEIPALGHNYGTPTYEWGEGDTTCTATMVCVNDNEHVVTETADATSAVTVAATCEEVGTRTFTAEFADEYFAAQQTTEVIPAIGHNYGTPTYEWGEGNSTCTATKICTNDSEHVVTETADATSTVTVAATCEAIGTRTFTAEFTDEGFATQQTTEEIPATGHKEVTDAAVAATCTAAGKTEGKHCEVCNVVLVAQEEIPALGHDFKTYKFDNNATTETDGTETAMCEHGCGTTDTRTAAGTKIATTPEKGTAVAESAANAISIYTCNNVIVVENATDEIRVYDAMGRMICRDAINRVRAEIPVNTAGLYIVRVGNVAKRVMINE